MPDEHHKRAFHYALEQDEDLAKHSLRELDAESLQDIGHACDLLKAWTMDVFFEPEAQT